MNRLVSALRRRRVRWISSTSGDPTTLADLERRMVRFYSDAEERASYQTMLGEQDGVDLPPESVRYLLPEFVAELAPARALEVGCGDGRLYRQLLGLGFQGEYTGLDMSAALTSENRARHPEVPWETGSTYRLPFGDGVFDCVFSLYVLEHLVYPRRGLEEMARVLKPGGRLALVFPDFVAGGILPSQAVGLSGLGTAREKLRSGRVLDALLSLYDSRSRIPHLLSRAPVRSGPFPVNTRPLCLEQPDRVAPDTDAVYIASKSEVAAWAEAQTFETSFPAGTEGELRFQTFLVITRPLRDELHP